LQQQYYKKLLKKQLAKLQAYDTKPDIHSAQLHFQLLYTCAYLQIHVKDFEMAAISLNKAKTVLEHIERGREWELKSIYLGYLQVKCHKKIHGGIESLFLIRNVLKNLKWEAFVTDGNVAYSQVEKVYLEAAKLAFYYQKV